MIAGVNLWLATTTVVLLPLLVPRGPGQSAPVDAVAVAYIVVSLAGRLRSRQPLRLPAKGPLLLIVAGSLLATAVSLSPRDSLLSLLVEAYLLLLYACVASDLDGDPRGLRTVLVAWSAAGLLWAAVFVGLHFQLLPQLLQQLLVANSSDGGVRVAGAAGNPNLAAGYMMTSLFVLLASPWPRARPARLLAAGWLLFALFLTGSNGALLGLAVGLPVLAVAASLRASRSAGGRLAVVGAALLAGALLLGGGALLLGVPQVGVSDVQTLARRERGGVFGDSLGRLDRSVNGRLLIWSDAWQAAGSQVAVGVGPGASSEIRLAGNRLKRGLHNDYIAFLIERGLLGLLGLLAFVALLLRWSGRLLACRLPDGRGGWWSPAALGAAVVANLVLATNHESFHFRHLWILFGLVWAAGRLAGQAGPAGTQAREPDAPTPKELAHALS